MKDLEKFLDDMSKKSHGIVVAIGGTVTGTKELLSINKQLDNAVYNLGIDIYEEYSEKPTSAVYKKFAESFKEINNLDKKKVELEEDLARKFGKKICPNCDSTIDVEDHFCPNCGEEQEVEESEVDIDTEDEDYNCPNCGEEYTEGQNFCSKCGEKLF